MDKNDSLHNFVVAVVGKIVVIVVVGSYCPKQKHSYEAIQHNYIFDIVDDYYYCYYYSCCNLVVDDHVVDYYMNLVPQLVLTLIDD